MFTTLNFWLWVAQALLAALYLFAGVTKATRPIPALRVQMGWVDDYAVTTVRFVGVVEVLGAIGLILPMVTGILPWLTVVAAIGLAVIQVLAIPVHIRRGETGIVPMNVILLALALFVVWGRWGLFAG